MKKDIYQEATDEILAQLKKVRGHGNKAGRVQGLFLIVSMEKSTEALMSLCYG